MSPWLAYRSHASNIKRHSWYYQRPRVLPKQLTKHQQSKKPNIIVDRFSLLPTCDNDSVRGSTPYCTLTTRLSLLIRLFRWHANLSEESASTRENLQLMNQLPLDLEPAYPTTNYLDKGDVFLHRKWSSED